MLRFFIEFLAVFVGSIIVGCAGLGVPQQPRLEIAESAKVFIVHPQSLFFSPQSMILDRRTDGSMTVHSVSGTSTAIGTHSLNGDRLFDADLAQLNEALLPFLVPACQVVLPFQQ